MDLYNKVTEQGNKIRSLKAAKASADQITAEVNVSSFNNFRRIIKLEVFKITYFSFLGNEESICKIFCIVPSSRYSSENMFFVFLLFQNNYLI